MKRQTLTGILIVVIVLIVGAIGFAAYSRGTFGPSGVVVKDSNDVSDYSAIFLTNGQVYFGKMYSGTTDQLDLRDIYYLQVSQQNIQPDPNTKASATPTAQPNISLIKLGKELHGPNDRMHINKSQILFTESLKNESQVVTAINKDKAGTK